MTVFPQLTTNDDGLLPAIGFGTYPLKGSDGVDAISSAIAAGYRLIDTAVNYENEWEVGEAVRRSGIDRDEIIVTTKIPGRHHGYDEAIACGRESNATIRLGRIDLLLIHWPIPRVDKYVDTFRGMIALRDEGLVGSVGVSNFTMRNSAARRSVPSSHSLTRSTTSPSDQPRSRMSSSCRKITRRPFSMPR